MKIRFKNDLIGLSRETIEKNYSKASDILDKLHLDTEAYTGWVNWPSNIPEEWMSKMEEVADEVSSKCDKLIVIGIGGSYLGTAAVIKALGGSKPGCPDVLYAGNNMSGSYHARFKRIVEENEICLCVVSKSGGTMESRLAFSILKGWMYEKYGREETAARIIAITDPEKGILRKEADEEGYVTFEIPSNIGGRYSAYTPGIMFPLAVAGVDIRAFVKGALDVSLDDAFWKNEGLKYALTRFALLESGKTVEVFEYYNPELRLIGEWCKQLFGESEGKDGKGIFPTSLIFSTDLHSMGQFLQDGNQIFFETVINFVKENEDVIVPASVGDELANRSLNDINQKAIKGVMAAHGKANIPINLIEVDALDEYCIGQLFYFLMMTAAVTGKLMDINPFNQPGVEAYKTEIRKLLGNREVISE